MKIITNHELEKIEIHNAKHAYLNACTLAKYVEIFLKHGIQNTDYCVESVQRDFDLLKENLAVLSGGRKVAFTEEYCGEYPFIYVQFDIVNKDSKTLESIAQDIVKNTEEATYLELFEIIESFAHEHGDFPGEISTSALKASYFFGKLFRAVSYTHLTLPTKA